MVWQGPAAADANLPAEQLLMLVYKKRFCPRPLSRVAEHLTGMHLQVYPATTNPAVSTGDGQAMAVRANARLAGMEFVQFHPTGFAGHTALAGQQTFLISEAVRRGRSPAHPGRPQVEQGQALEH